MKKDKLEQFFNQHLDNFEAPYDAGAWESMSSQLDAAANTGGAGSSSTLLKWSAAVVGSAAIIAGGVWFANSTGDDIAIENKTIVVENNEEPNKTEIQTNDLKKESNALNAVPTPSNISSKETPTKNGIEAISTLPQDKSASHSDNSNSNLPTGTPANTPDVKPDQTEGATPQRKEYRPGSVSATLVCAGDQVSISNHHEQAYVKLLVNNRIETLAPGKSVSISPTVETVISFLDRKDEIASSVTVNVVKTAAPSIDVDANIYDEGLPVARFRAYGDFKEIYWDFGNQTSSNSADAVAHYFDKGVYDVKAIVTDIHGCQLETNVQVEIFEKYNLLATNSMRLNDANMETRTFMPFCLKERNANFNLTIIDPKDNAVVYQTNDYNKPWDGIDMRSGRLVPVNKTFIWQVQLDETIPGERGIYKGTLTVLE